MKRNVVLSIVGLFLTTLMAFAKEEPKSIPWDQTGPFKHVDGSGPYRKSAELLRHQRNIARLAASGAESREIPLSMMPTNCGGTR